MMVMVGVPRIHHRERRVRKGLHRNKIYQGGSKAGSHTPRLPLTILHLRQIVIRPRPRRTSLRKLIQVRMGPQRTRSVLAFRVNTRCPSSPRRNRCFPHKPSTRTPILSRIRDFTLQTAACPRSIRLLDIALHHLRRPFKVALSILSNASPQMVVRRRARRSRFIQAPLQNTPPFRLTTPPLPLVHPIPRRRRRRIHLSTRLHSPLLITQL